MNVENIAANLVMQSIQFDNTTKCIYKLALGKWMNGKEGRTLRWY